MGIQKASLQKSYELAVGAHSYTVDFTAANRQFDWLGISLVYVKSNKHQTVYDRYSAKMASATKIS